MKPDAMILSKLPPLLPRSNTNLLTARTTAGTANEQGVIIAVAEAAGEQDIALVGAVKAAAMPPTMTPAKPLLTSLHYPFASIASASIGVAELPAG